VIPGDKSEAEHQADALANMIRAALVAATQDGYARGRYSAGAGIPSPAEVAQKSEAANRAAVAMWRKFYDVVATGVLS
jgi:hypothetical protein